MNVAIIGASDQVDRYANKALHMLAEYGHQVFLVNPKLNEIEGQRVFPDVSALPEKVHTLTMYVRPETSSKMEKEILLHAPQRVIFNPGAENPALAEALRRSGIHVVEACTLVLLRTHQFPTA